MGLKPPNAGLRTIHHNAISASKVHVSVPPGEFLVVSDTVADQLIASAGEFKDVTVADAPPSVPVTKPSAKKSAAKKS